MVGPLMSHKQEEDLTLKEKTKQLFQVLYNQIEKEGEEKEEAPKIKVSSLVSKMAFFYEKIRNAVDYQEEHLLRKTAIERILKRQILIEGFIKSSESYEIASHLLIELIRAGYLPNDTIPETKKDEIGAILKKYIKLKNASVKRFSKGGNKEKIKNRAKEKNDLVSWIISLAATEIEENLAINEEKELIINHLYEILSNNVQLPENSKYGKDLKIQIYLSVYRNYLKYDNSMLSLLLFKYYVEGWKNNNISEEKIEKVSQEIIKLKQVTERQLNHPLIKQLDKITSKYALFFTILTETIRRKPSKIYQEVRGNFKSYISSIKKTAEEKYKQIKSKLWRAAFRSIVYIFLTKSIFVIIIEVPAIKWLGESLNYLSLGINIIFPALLLFFIILVTKKPSPKNTEKIIEGIKEITYKKKERKQPLVLKRPIKRNRVINTIFRIIYGLAFFFSIYLVIWVLTQLDFNWVSIIIFLFFLALVSFFSIRIKKNLKDFIIEDKKENFFGFLLDFFYMPIVAVGKWLSRNMSRVNVFMFLMDFIIEAPFKVVVNVIEDWTRYVREKKEDIM